MTDFPSDSSSIRSDVKEELPRVGEAEGAIINAGPALYCNRIFSTVYPQGMRLTFAEANPATPLPEFRTAVFLSYTDTLLLIDLLERQLAAVREFDRQSAEAG